eukprot:scaffold70885_cov29-Prasinocladus_malaysianus.AAC.1
MQASKQVDTVWTTVLLARNIAVSAQSGSDKYTLVRVRAKWPALAATVLTCLTLAQVCPSSQQRNHGIYLL